MLLKASVAAVALACAVTAAPAQQTLDWPVSDFEPYQLDTGVLSNLGSRAATAYANVVHVDDAGWLRVYFGEVTLEGGSFIRVTSLTDLETQVLDAATLDMWDYTTAYFNGDTLLLEVVAAAGTKNNRVAIDEIARQDYTLHSRGSGGQCGICGGTDDRAPSSETWTGRLLPAGCTASVWNTDSCLVSAGHCIGGGDVIQFNVPNSSSFCSLNHPPVADQFPIIQEQHVNGGVGNDWAAMVSGTNNIGQTPFDRFGTFRPISATTVSNGQTLGLWGYGVDQTCTRSQTQQTHSGPVTSVFSTWFEYSIDLRGGNSGSALIRSGEIVGIATHCPCPNVATRMDRSNFVTARQALCPDTPAGTEATMQNFAVKKGTLLGGVVSDMGTSNNVYVTVASDNTGNKKQANVEVNMLSPVATANVTQLDLKFEYRLDVASVPTRIEVRNWTAGGWTLLQNVNAPTTDGVVTFNNIANPSNYVKSGNGQIRVRIRPIKSNIAGFTLFIDEVEATVYD